MLIAACSKELSNCCHDAGIISLISILKNILDVIQIIVPIILIAFLSVQLTKMVMNPDEKKNMSRIKNQFIATILVFMVPVIVNALIGIMPQSFQLSACWNVAGGKDEVLASKSQKYISIHKESSKNIFNKRGEYEKGETKVFGSKKAKEAGTSTTSGDYGGLNAGDASGIIAGAEKVHTMYEQQGWYYYSSLGQLRWNNIKYSTNNPSKATCCATFVGSALLVGGVFTEAEINKYNYNSQYGISELCQAHKWIKISNYGSLQTGDIVIMTSPSSGGAPGHVQIYAGNGTWYNAGSTNAIQRANPYSSDASGRFLWAWRIPA